MEAQLREVQAGYRRLGDDVAFQQEQLWNQVPCLLGPPALYPGPDPDTVLIATLGLMLPGTNLDRLQ